MDPVWIGFLGALGGAIVGALASFGTTYFTHKQNFKMAKEERLANEKNTRDSFIRSTLNDLNDKLKLHNDLQLENYRQFIKFKTTENYLLPDSFMEKGNEMLRCRVDLYHIKGRILDDEIRRLLQKYLSISADIQNVDNSVDRLKKDWDLRTQTSAELNQRIGVIFRNTFKELE